MNKVNSWIELLGGWCLGRRPRTSDTRHMIGSWAAKAMLSFIVFEWVVQLGWKGNGTYSYASNYVSDLGAVHCDNVGNPARYVCSPSFAAMDLALIFIGVNVVVAACLITSPVLWIAAHAGDLDDAYKAVRRDKTDGKIRMQPTGFAKVTTTIIRWSLAVTGLAIFAIGVFPEDYPNAGHTIGIHDPAVVILSLGIFVTLVSIGVLWFRRTDASLWFFGLAIVAGVSGLLMLLTGGKTEFSGIFERGVIYAFIVGLAILGFMVSSAAHHERVGHLQPRPATRPLWGPRQAGRLVAPFRRRHATVLEI